MLKPWPGCIVAEQASVIGVFMDYSSGVLDSGSLIHPVWTPEAWVSSTKNEQVRVSLQCHVREVVVNTCSSSAKCKAVH